VVASAASAVAQAFGRFTYPLLLTAIASDLGLTYTVAGGLASVNLVAYLLGTVTVTVLAARLIPGAILRLGLVGSVTGLGLAALAPGPVALAAALAVTGFSGALVWVPAPAVGVSRLPARLRGLGFGSIGAGIGLGIVAAGILAIPIRAHPDPGAWRWLFGVEAAVGVVVLLVTAVALRRPTGAKLAVTGVKVSAIRAVPGWVALLAAYGTFGFAYAWFMNFLVAMLEVDRAITATSASVVFLVMGAATIPGGVVVGRLSDLFGRRRTLATAFALMAVGSLGARFAPPWLLFASVALFGFTFAGIPTVIAAYLGDRAPEAAFSAAFGVATLSFGVSQMLAPQVGGIIGDALGGFTLVFVGSAVLAIGGVVASLRLPPDQPRS